MFEPVIALLPPLLGGVFLAAAAAKLLDWHQTVEWFNLLRIPYAERVAQLGVVSEGVLVVMLITLPTVGAAFTAVWLMAATALLLRGWQLDVGCGCFGAVQARSRMPFLRNFGLFAICVAIMVLSHVKPIGAADATAVALLGPAAFALRRETWSPTS